jgi:hypothetical protein
LEELFSQELPLIQTERVTPLSFSSI